MGLWLSYRQTQTVSGQARHRHHNRVITKCMDRTSILHYRLHSITILTTDYKFPKYSHKTWIGWLCSRATVCLSRLTRLWQGRWPHKKYRLSNYVSCSIILYNGGNFYIFKMSPVIFEFDCMCVLKKMRLTIDINT